MGYIGMNESIPKKTLFLVPPLPLVEDAKDKDEKPKATDVIEFVLKQRAGSTATAPAICNFLRREDELMTELMIQRLNFIVK